MFPKAYLPHIKINKQKNAVIQMRVTAFFIWQG